MLKLDQFPMERMTDRDLELPVFFEFLKRTKGKIESALDVGAHYSAGYYALELREYVRKYIALDPNYDKEVAEIADEFLTTDATKINLPETDLVLCLSTIEHVGQYPFKFEDFLDQRLNLFCNMLEAAKKYLWISFPVSKYHVIENEMCPITPDELENFLIIASGYKISEGYFWSEGPQGGYPWKKSTKEKLINEDYIDSLGNRGICILEIEK